MYRVVQTVRVSIVAMLMFSMAASGLCAPLLAEAAGASLEGARNVAGPSTLAPVRTTCCCGTPDGRCCGMGCCVAQSPKQLPANPPLRSSTDRHETRLVAIASAVDGRIEAGDSGQTSLASTHLGGLLPAGSLQAQHVRIQT
jgi:hypothetical protein